MVSTYLLVEWKVYARGFDAGYAAANTERRNYAIFKRSLLLAKLETSYGSDPAPSPSSDATGYAPAILLDLGMIPSLREQEESVRRTATAWYAGSGRPPAKRLDMELTP